MPKTTPLVAASAAFALAACTNGPSLLSTQDIEETHGMLTIVTSGDTETQVMALVLTKSAMDEGQSPHILLCAAGGDLALTDAPPNATEPLQPKGASPQGLLQKLIDDGVQVDVCAIYLPNRPFGPEALLDGVGVAKPDDIGRAIARPGETILSF
jgi:hypothetical protein